MCFTKLRAQVELVANKGSYRGIKLYPVWLFSACQHCIWMLRFTQHWQMLSLTADSSIDLSRKENTKHCIHLFFFKNVLNRRWKNLFLSAAFKWDIFMHCRTWNVHPCAVCSVSREALAWRFNHACMHRRTLPGGICGLHLALCNSTYFSYSSSLSFEFNHRHGNRAAAVTHTHARPKINKNPKARARAETAVWGRRCYDFKWMVEDIIVNSRPHFCSNAPFAFRS